MEGVYPHGIYEQLDELRTQALALLAQADTAVAIAAWKAAHLGRNGGLTRLSRELGALTPAERPRAGQMFNRVRHELEQALVDAEQRIMRGALAVALDTERLDVTLPGRPALVGRIHPVNQALRLVIETFQSMGFQVWESPDVETDELNFSLLNMPPDHPARDLQDTFFVDVPSGSPPVVLRTHTSPGQIRAMRELAPNPVRVLVPGRCHRREDVTARHGMMFSQFEFLVIGHAITMGHLKGTLAAMAVRLFGPGTRVRLRASYFPFTEPSAELDISCVVCGGAGCRICKDSGWLELGGCGMVHPTVLRNGGYDPDIFSGFAGGFGIERVAILRYGVDDTRLFYANDMRFLEQFG